MTAAGGGAVDVAVIDPGHPDAGVPAHYGDPLREQRRAATEVALVDRSHRGLVEVTGPDRLSWLHNTTSQHLTGLDAFEGTEALMLSPTGHVEQHLGILDDGGRTLLDCEPGGAGDLVAGLARMVFRARVRVEDVTAGFAQWSLLGPAAGEVLRALGGRDLPEPGTTPVPPPRFATGTLPARPTTRCAVCALPDFGGYARRTQVGVDLLIPRSAVGDLLDRARVALAGVWAYEALRVARVRPRLGFETDHRTLPAEVGWFSAVHLAKGCYRGQEAVARVHNLGRPPRRLVGLHLDGSGGPVSVARHQAVSTADGVQVGYVGTAATHYEWGPIATAVVRRGVEDGQVLRVAGLAARVDPQTLGANWS